MMIRALTLALCCAPFAAKATVYEYSANGEVTVSRSDGAPSQARAEQVRRPASVPARRAAYRSMAEEVALRHAGGDGPRRAGLDAMTFAQLFVELIRAESAFNPRALSPKGAQGLGQLMPATARELGVRDVWDPSQNLDGAVRYFTAQLERFGSVPLALAAYNAGPHRVVQYGGIPPFRETRAYVAKITAAVGQVPTAEPEPAQPRRSTTPTMSTKNPEKDISVWQY